jgi:hypothetical protein
LKRAFQKTNASGEVETWRIWLSGKDVIRETRGPGGTEKDEEWFLDPQNAADYFVRKKIQDGWKELTGKEAALADPPKPRIPASKPEPLDTAPVTVEGRTFPKIDRAVAKVRAFVCAWPERQVLVEDVPPGADLIKRCADVEKYTQDFVRTHAPTFGRWHRKGRPAETRRILRAEAPAPYRYFCARYGSLTWVSPLEARGVGFLIGNVTGEGWGVLQICDWFTGPSMEELIPGGAMKSDLQG